MAYDEQLAERVRSYLAMTPNEVVEKPMMGGLTFMVNGKMCAGIFKNELMCRIDPAEQETALKRQGSRIMDFTTRPMKGYILVGPSGIDDERDFEYWVGLALAFNPKAKASRK